MDTTSKPKKPRKATGQTPVPMIATAEFSRSPFRDQTVSDDAIPEDWRGRAARANCFYQEEPLVSNAVNAWRTFAIGDEVYPRCEDDAIQEQVQDAFWTLGISRFVKDMIQQLLVKGDCVGYITRAPDGTPERVQCVNPISVEIKTDKSGAVTGYVQRANNSETPLTSDRLFHGKWNVPEFEQRGQSMILPAFESIMLLRDYRRAERAIAKRWAVPLRFIQVGGVYQNGIKIIPGTKEINAVRDAIEAADLRSGLVVPFYVKAETYGLDNTLDTSKPMTAVKEDILVAMGLSRSIVTGDSANFATASVSMQRMVVMLKEIKQAARDILDWIFDPWIAALSPDAIVEYEFSDLDLTDEIEAKKFLLELRDRGLLSDETLLTRCGLSVDVEATRTGIEGAFVNRVLKVDDIIKLVTLGVMTPEEARERIGLDEDLKNAETNAAQRDAERSVYQRRKP